MPAKPVNSKRLSDKVFGLAKQDSADNVPRVNIILNHALGQWISDGFILEPTF